MPKKEEFLDLDGIEVKISNPDKVYFPQAGLTKMDLVGTTWPWPRARSAGCATGRWP